jgi:hypothetical protein
MSTSEEMSTPEVMAVPGEPEEMFTPEVMAIPGEPEEMFTPEVMAIPGEPEEMFTPEEPEEMAIPEEPEEMALPVEPPTMEPEHMGISSAVGGSLPSAPSSLAIVGEGAVPQSSATGGEEEEQGDPASTLTNCLHGEESYTNCYTIIACMTITVNNGVIIPMHTLQDNFRIKSAQCNISHHNMSGLCKYSIQLHAQVITPEIANAWSLNIILTVAIHARRLCPHTAAATRPV